MARAGYCHDCGAWTWVQPDGSCPTGHLPARVTDHYEANTETPVTPLAPAPPTAPAAQTGAWEPCPRCGATRVQQLGSCAAATAGFGTMGCGLWLLIIPPVGIVVILAGLITMLISPAMHKMLQCQDCKYVWRYPYANSPQAKQAAKKAARKMR